MGFIVHCFADLKICDYRIGHKGQIQEWPEIFCTWEVEQWTNDVLKFCKGKEIWKQNQNLRTALRLYMLLQNILVKNANGKWSSLPSFSLHCYPAVCLVLQAASLILFFFIFFSLIASSIPVAASEHITRKPLRGLDHPEAYSVSSCHLLKKLLLTWGAVTKCWYMKSREWKPTVHKEIRASDYYIIPQTHGNIYSAIPARWKWFPDFLLVQIIVYACKFRDELNATSQFHFWLLCQCSWIIKNPPKDFFFFRDWLKCTDVSVHHPGTYICFPPSLLFQSASSWFVSGVFLLFPFCLLWNISAFKRFGNSSCSGHTIVPFIQETGFIFILISKSSIPPH